MAIASSTALAIAAAAAAASAGAGMYSASQQASAAKKQNAMNQRVADQQMALSNEQLALAKAPTTDARGNRSEYIEGRGWVDTASPITRTLMQRSDAEEGLRLASDLPRERMRRENTFVGQLQDAGLAQALLSRSEVGRRDLSAVEGGQILTGLADAAASQRNVRNGAVLTALRQGTGAQELLAQQGRQNIADRRSVLAHAAADAPGAFSAAEEQRITGPLNRYSSLMSSARAPDAIPFAPSQLAESLTAARTKQQAIGTQLLGQAGRNIEPAKVNVVDPMIGQMIASGAGAFRNIYGMYTGDYLTGARNPYSEVLKKPGSTGGQKDVFG